MILLMLSLLLTIMTGIGAISLGAARVKEGEAGVDDAWEEHYKAWHERNLKQLKKRGEYVVLYLNNGCERLPYVTLLPGTALKVLCFLPVPGVPRRYTFSLLKVKQSRQ